MSAAPLAEAEGGLEDAAMGRASDEDRRGWVGHGLLEDGPGARHHLRSVPAHHLQRHLVHGKRGAAAGLQSGAERVHHLEVPVDDSEVASLGDLGHRAPATVLLLVP